MKHPSPPHSHMKKCFHINVTHIHLSITLPNSYRLMMMIKKLSMHTHVICLFRSVLCLHFYIGIVTLAAVLSNEGENLVTEESNCNDDYSNSF